MIIIDNLAIFLSKTFGLLWGSLLLNIALIIGGLKTILLVYGMISAKFNDNKLW
ncbi:MULTISPECIES: hypothetical protein [unclassified Gilliamella]|uniref:hypothetical protein n=1 Tax=unclassified Gilliamella TaxID=2685620 RepID=UPI00130D2C63|nr:MULTISPECIES: hypothetical protein [unclassified Gilliamella]MWP49074.1 hypothetical protein [Gilliamella sp. Lep-s35]MWP69312.1 hypothetical protein [Gilliamella sp. Lep-s5]MWP76875.1 hypothetical protein [Gilliamella sp. Lep-s21]